MIYFYHTDNDGQNFRANEEVSINQDGLQKKTATILC